MCEDPSLGLRIFRIVQRKTSAQWTRCTAAVIKAWFWSTRSLHRRFKISTLDIGLCYLGQFFIIEVRSSLSTLTLHLAWPWSLRSYLHQVVPHQKSSTQRLVRSSLVVTDLPLPGQRMESGNGRLKNVRAVDRGQQHIGISKIIG